MSNGLGVLLILVNRPVKDIIILKALADKEIAENLSEVAVVRLIVKSKRACIVEVDGELVGEATAENLSGGRHLLLHDSIILLLLCGSLKTLPGQGTTAEVQHDVTQRFHIVTSRLLDTKMRVDGGISGSASQVLVLSIRNVEMRLGIAVLLGQTKINHVNLITPLPNAHEEVIRFDISVDKRLCVDVLDSRNELVSEKKNSLQGKLPVAKVEQVLQARPEEIENHGIIIALGSKPANERDANAPSKRLVHAGLVLKLRVLCLDGFEFNGNLLARNDIGTEVNITKRTRSNLAADAILVTDAKVLSEGQLSFDGTSDRSEHTMVVMLAGL